MKHAFRSILLIFLFCVLSLVCAACATGQAEEPQTFTVHYLAEEGGKIKGIADQILKAGADAAPVTAQADEGYTFVKWSDGIETPTRTDKNLSQDLTVTAEFEKKTYYTVRYETDGNGTVEGKAEQSVEHGKNASSVTAIPNEGYEFVKWSDGTETPTRTDKNVTEDLTVKAEFEKITCTLRYLAGENGTVEGETEQTLLYGENASSVTAIPNEGYKFAGWSDGEKNATRRDINVTRSLTVTAEFTKIQYREVTYRRNGGGTIVDLNTGEEVFRYSVLYEGDAPPVKAVPYENRTFLYWSDGSTDPVRQDTNIRFPITVTAYFGDYIDYKVYGGVGGTIAGKAHQEALTYEEFESVTAVPDAGYLFMGWSDGVMSAERRDNSKRAREAYYAYFEPIEKTFRYDYGIASGTPTATEITINRYQIQNTKFVIPQVAGYTFCGWYADSDFRMKVSDAGGKLFTGYYTFLLETDTLYAKWQKQGEEITTFKILMPVVDEVHALLYSYTEQKDYVVDYKMSYMEKKIYAFIPAKFGEYLNEWFAGKVIFEVDAYYTIQAFGSTENRVGRGDAVSNRLSWPQRIPEIHDMLDDYHGAIGSDSMNDPLGALRENEGEASAKYGAVSFDSILLSYNISAKTKQETYERLLSGLYWDELLEVYLHEFTHTIEMRVPWESVGSYGYHSSAEDYKKIYGVSVNGVNCEVLAAKLYLLHEAVTPDGRIVGIPPAFWENPALWNEYHIQNL